MNRIPLLAVLFATTPALTLHAAEERPAKPNILLLLTDDLGWQDLKCYDIDEPSPMETPHLDALAKKGVMFWQAYSPAPTCAPSRCAILSGNHPARARKTHVVGGKPPTPRSEKSKLMEPWYSGRIPADELTLARLLKQNGYTTGHSGKWHMAIDHSAFPQPGDVGFDYTRSSRGSRRRMEDRLSSFATTDPKDAFRLDKNGYPFDQTNEDAITFMEENVDKPFFLYYATWLVHSPIHTRSEERLQKYAKKLGIDPAKPPGAETPGQLNPFYAAMIEEMDYYLGQVITYLETTEDPRWPGHMLSENTYIIFTSDNGGMEGGSKERYTENAPLDRGKSSTREGGIRVPLIITGPGIPKGVQTDVLANGLDFYPTILSMTGVQKPAEKNLDGLDLLPLLTGDPENPELVREADGTARDTMMWHFPHNRMESSIRIGDYKLTRHYDPDKPTLELFRLYDSTSGKSERADIEEAKNLVKTMPEKAQAMDTKLTEILGEMDAAYPCLNPNYKGELAHKDQAPTAIKADINGRKVTLTFQENGAKVTAADLIYTTNGGQKYEEWFRAPMTIEADTATAQLPGGTTHYIFNLNDENHFLVSYPEMKSSREYSGKGYTSTALKAP